MSYLNFKNNLFESKGDTFQQTYTKLKSDVISYIKETLEKSGSGRIQIPYTKNGVYFNSSGEYYEVNSITLENNVLVFDCFLSDSDLSVSIPVSKDIPIEALIEVASLI